MRCSSILVPVAMLVCALTQAPGTAAAADWYTGAEPQKGDGDWIVAVNTSVDITSQGSRFADINATMAPAGTLHESGLRLRVDGTGGTYSYQSTTTGGTVNGVQEDGAAMAGYEWVMQGTSIAVYAGADARHDSLSIPDPGNPVVGTSVGLKTSAEFSTRPAAQTNIEGYASYATNKSAYFTRLRGGYLIAPGIYVGPEVAALGDAFFNQERVGVHVSGVKLGMVQLALAGGYLNDRVRKQGAYVSLDAHVGF